MCLCVYVFVYLCICVFVQIKKYKKVYSIIDMKVILTIFAGRRKNMEVLVKYLKKALELKIIDEVHLWNYTKNNEDDMYIKSISNLKRTSSYASGRYVQIFTPIINNKFSFDIKASNDIHVKIASIDKIIEYEVVIGSNFNNRTLVRKNRSEIINIPQYNFASATNYIKITVEFSGNYMIVYLNEKMIINFYTNQEFKIGDIFVKTGHNSVGTVSFQPIKNEGFYLMDICEKGWKNYYQHYAQTEYFDDIILKTDDDIVFIDLLKLPKFIDFVKSTDYDCVFANTINNGVSAYFQQNRFGLIPNDLMTLEYPNGGTEGSLWADGKKAELLHNYFIKNYEKFLNHPYNNEILQIITRFSINFFGYKGSNWHKIADCYIDDEWNLTVGYVQERNFRNVLYADFYVSHLSFYKQVETEIDSDDLVQKYHQLYDNIEHKFKI